jgi:hypothetical protein
VLSRMLLLFGAAALIGCSGPSQTDSGVEFVTEGSAAESQCAQTGGALTSPRAGGECGVQANGDGCIWSPMSVDLGAQSAEASCDGVACACVTQGNVHQACAAPPACDCGAQGLYGETQGCMDSEDLDASFADGNVATLASDAGVYLTFRPGAIDDVAHYQDLSELVAAHPWIAAQLEQGCALEPGTPPHDCDAGFGEAAGCFLSASDDFARVSSLMANLVEYAGSSYSDAAIGHAAAHEAGVVASVVMTEPGLALHFGRDADGWKLLVIDASRYDCGA